MQKIEICSYSDVLCIWAYVAERRMEELAENFGDQIAINTRFCSVFPDAWSKIEKKTDGFEGFNRHLQHVAEDYPHIDVHKDVWLTARPRTSFSPHVFLKAVALVEDEQSPPRPFLDRASTRATRETRSAFFAEAKDISDRQVHKEIAARIGIDYQAIDEKIRSSEAVAAVAADYDLAQKHGIQGSPTVLMNEGRQKLFGNVGYRLLEANVQELARRKPENEASWC